MSESSFEIPAGVQDLEPGELFFLWDTEGVVSLRVISVSYDEEGCATVSAAITDALPPCHDLPDCPLMGQETNCEDCGLLTFTFCDIVYEIAYESAFGHTAAGCYCLAKELDESA